MSSFSLQGHRIKMTPAAPETSEAAGFFLVRMVRGLEQTTRTVGESTRRAERSLPGETEPQPGSEAVEIS